MVDQRRPDTNYWQGRTDELAKMQQWLDSGEVKLIGVVAAGGFGKSAIVAKLSDAAGEFTQQIWTTFSQVYPFAVWGRWLLDVLKQPAPEKPEELMIAVCNALQLERYLLIWDNLETILEANGKWRDDAYRQFLLRWFSSQSSSKILVTSREQPALPANTLNYSRWLSLDGLNTDAGVALLQALEIQGDDAQLRDFVTQATGHPLLLKLAAGVLRAEEGETADISAWRENVYQILGLHRDDPEASIAKILDTSVNRLSPRLQQLLVSLSVYRLAFDGEAAMVMCFHPSLQQEGENPNPIQTSPPTPLLGKERGVDKENLTPNPSPKEERGEIVEKDLRYLVKRSLLQERKQQGKWIFQFQPLIQGYLQQRSTATEKEQAHQQAISYYEQHRKPQLEPIDELEAVREYLEIFHHHCELGEYGQGIKIITQATNADNRYSSCDFLLQLRGYNGVRLTVYQRLVEEWSPQTDEEVIPFIDAIQAYGDVLQFLDRRDEALERYEQALQFYRQIGSRLGEANTLKAIADVLQFLDRRDEALERYEQALQFYRQIGSRLGEANTLQAIADVLQFLDRRDEALERYEQALQFYRQIGSRLGEANTLKAIADVL
ncbi:MAG: tetratricopeptide repeat protein, partial [Nostocaceae cyanobacterium]|nr:tetratricopeptide repeat protein [Nostocaceae cyanobacterium]